MAAIMVWLLPEPNSPTMATVSPRRTLMSTPLTARTSPSMRGEADLEAADVEDDVVIVGVFGSHLNAPWDRGRRAGRRR